MTRKRKRPSAPAPSTSIYIAEEGTALTTGAAKRSRRDAQASRSSEGQAKGTSHPTLALYFPKLWTLREYLLARIPKHSKIRRRRLLALIRVTTSDRSSPAQYLHGQPNSGRIRSPTLQNDLCHLLDTTLVGSLVEPSCVIENIAHAGQEAPIRAFETFATQRHQSSTAGSGTGAISSISDLVDFAIWHLFHRIHRQTHKPPHLLCRGFQRAAYARAGEGTPCMVAGIPGIDSYYPNHNVSVLKNGLWSEVLSLLGKDGDQIMLDLLLKSCIFLPIGCGKQGNFSQLSGTPLTDLPTLESISINRQVQTLPVKSVQPIPHALSTITFVRNRMLYARPALNAKGRVTFGLRHIHALNRYPDSTNPVHTLRLLQYIFPRQFHLHNVFTSVVDSKETVQRFKDYTLREQEFKQHDYHQSLKQSSHTKSKAYIPRRLRGKPTALVQMLQRRHKRCAYTELLQYYCPVLGQNHAASQSQQSLVNVARQMQHFDPDHIAPTEISSAEPSRHAVVPGHGPQGGGSSQAKPTDIIDLATPYENVSAYCRAALARLIPAGFYGAGQAGFANRDALMTQVDQFIKLRRFESMTLHDVLYRQKVNVMTWLSSPRQDSTKSCNTDSRKRREILCEFFYYIFDSILMPLIRSNFHVTEANAHGNRLFYFRHDVWRHVTEPAMSRLKSSMFEEIDTTKARRMLDSRTLGFSQIRLLPKGASLRPITNLRRRVTRLHNGRVTLGRSINSIMTPVFNMLDLERRIQPDRAGSALFSVGDMYPRLKDFKQCLERQNDGKEALYFAKCDVKACFDTLPQRAVVRLMEDMASEESYRIARHAEIRQDRVYHRLGTKNTSTARPARNFVSSAKIPTDFMAFEDFLSKDDATSKRGTIFVDGIVQQPQETENMLDLLEEHIQSNVVKIGKKYFRQKRGIPQGSVLSSLLCNLFYGDLERKHLGFLDGSQSLLLRLIDDFLLITTNEDHARQFMHILDAGIADFGLETSRAKSLANFNLILNDGQIVPKISRSSSKFPFCGMLIDVRTLNLSKDRDRRLDTVLTDSLTVDHSRTPGMTFYRKAINAFKIQTHKMLLDTGYNATQTVLATLYENFLDAAMKYYRYLKSMGVHMIKRTGLLTDTIRDLVEVAYVLAQTPPKGASRNDYRCTIGKPSIAWLAYQAFRHVLARKQSQFGAVVAWLDEEIASNSVTIQAARSKIATHHERTDNCRPKSRMPDRLHCQLQVAAARGNEIFAGYKY